MVVVSNSGTGLSACSRIIMNSVQPNITPSAPALVRSAIISRSFAFDSGFTIPTQWIRVQMQKPSDGSLGEEWIPLKRLMSDSAAAGFLPRQFLAQRHIADFKKKLSPPQKFSEAAFHEINNEIAELRRAVIGEEESGRTMTTERQISPVERF